MSKQNQLNQSIESLENCVWPAPSVDAPPFQTRCHRLRSVPIGRLNAGDLRVLLTQGIGSLYLMPIALEILADTPIVEGDCYPGDLLNAAILAALSLDPKSRKPFIPSLRETTKSAITELERDEDTARVNRKFLRELKDFLATTDA